jgi:hypothetical protein
MEAFAVAQTLGLVATTIGTDVTVTVGLYRRGYRFVACLTFVVLLLILPPILFLPVTFISTFMVMLVGGLIEGSLPREMLRAFTGTAQGAPIWYLALLSSLVTGIVAGIGVALYRRGIALALVLFVCVLLIPFVAYFILWLLLFIGMGVSILGGRGF